MLSYMRAKAQEKIQKKNSILEFIKESNFCIPKDTIKKVKRQLTEWEKIFVNQKTEQTPGDTEGQGQVHGVTQSRT